MWCAASRTHADVRRRRARPLPADPRLPVRRAQRAGWLAIFVGGRRWRFSHDTARV